MNKAKLQCNIFLKIFVAFCLLSPLDCRRCDYYERYFGCGFAKILGFPLYIVCYCEDN